VAVNLYTFLNLYDRALVAASHLLDKGLAHAAANGISERDMLGWRLIDDMQPLGFQLMVVASFSCQWAARVAGLPVPDRISPDLDAAGFRKAIAEAREYLAALKPEQFAGRDDVPLTVQITEGLEPTLPAGQWLSSFATTNIHFHLSTLYGILRAHGVPIGKADLFAGGLRGGAASPSLVLPAEAGIHFRPAGPGRRAGRGIPAFISPRTPDASRRRAT